MSQDQGGLQSLWKANVNLIKYDDNPCVKLIKDDDSPCVKLMKGDDNPCVKLIKDVDNPYVNPCIKLIKGDQFLVKPLKCDICDNVYVPLTTFSQV